MSDVLFFKSKNEIRKWFKANHKKLSSQWIGFHKKVSGNSLYSSADVVMEALCFGWTYVTMKSIDYYSYKINFMKRKDNSSWGAATIKQFKVLQKKKLVSPAGLEAFEKRNRKAGKKVSDQLTAAQIRQFQKNKKAWTFFKEQTASYQKYMAHWVNGAVQEATINKRLAELIQDSADQTKLRRVVNAMEKYKARQKYPAGETPIEEGKNLGPATGRELRSLGIETLEQLKSMGWEKVFDLWVQHYPHRMHLMALYALIGAVEDQRGGRLDPSLKSEAKAFMQEMKRGFLR